MVNTLQSSQASNTELAEKLASLRIGLALALNPHSDLRHRAFKETQRNAFFTAADLNTLDDVVELLLALSSMLRQQD